MVNEAAEALTLLGHGGPVFDLSWAPDEDDDAPALLASASADATARLWRVQGLEGALQASCVMVCSHGGAALAACFLDRSTLATGGMDRILRLWHEPSRRATSWAHVNDAITTLAVCHRRPSGYHVAIGLRGGQVFGYTAKSNASLDFDDMYLATVRAGAFHEAEKVGTSGISTAPPEAPLASEPEAARAPRSSWLHFGRKSPPTKAKVDDVAPEDDLTDDDDATATEPVATANFARRRVTSLAWYRSGDDLRLLVAANSEPVKVFDRAHPSKPPTKVLAGGVRISLGCGAIPDDTATLAVGGSEDGALLVWRLQDDQSLVDPAVVDLGPSPKVTVQAITTACFVPAKPAAAALGPDLGSHPSTTFLLAGDYRGLLVVCRHGRAGPKPPAGLATSPRDSSLATNNPLAGHHEPPDLL